MFSSSQLLKIIGGQLINLVLVISAISRFWDKEDLEDRLNDGNGDEDVEQVFPSQIRGNRTADHGCQVRHGGEEETDDGEVDPALVDEEEITDDDEQELFVGAD